MSSLSSPERTELAFIHADVCVVYIPVNNECAGLSRMKFSPYPVCLLGWANTGQNFLIRIMLVFLVILSNVH